MYEALRYTGQGKCGGCALKVHVFIRGELHAMRPSTAMGAGLGPGAKAPLPPPDPNVAYSAARAEVTPYVNVQKSAEAIVDDRARNGPESKGRTR